MQRPAETVAGTIGVAVGAIVGLLAAFGVPVPSGATAPIITIIGLVSGAVTWFIARRQRAGSKTSAADGKVG